MNLVIWLSLVPLTTFAGPQSALDDLKKRASSLQVGMGSDAVATPSIECAGSSRQSGLVGDSRLGIDLNMSKTKASLTLEHKLDIDAHEDRCITSVRIESYIEDTGCALQLHYRTTPYDPRLSLVSASFTADSFCPGWDDDVEGVYGWSVGSDAPKLTLSKDYIDQRTARESCVEITAQLNGTLETRTGRKKSPLTFDYFVVSGTFPSMGDTQGVCPRSPIQSSAATPIPPKPISQNIKNAASVYLAFGSVEGLDFEGRLEKSSYTTAGVQYSRALGERTALYTAVGNNSLSESTQLSLGYQGFLIGKYTQGLFLDLQGGVNTGPEPVPFGALKLGYKLTVQPGISLEAKLGAALWSLREFYPAVQRSSGYIDSSYDIAKDDPVTWGERGISVQPEFVLVAGWAF